MAWCLYRTCTVQLLTSGPHRNAGTDASAAGRSDLSHHITVYRRAAPDVRCACTGGELIYQHRLPSRSTNGYYNVVLDPRGRGTSLTGTGRLQYRVGCDALTNTLGLHIVQQAIHNELKCPFGCEGHAKAMAVGES
jgi:hypothetical protein